MSLLAVRGVTAGFGSQIILHAVDLEVPEGSAVGLFGLNGAGKSVLLKVIAGIVPIRSGSIAFDGKDISQLSPERRVALGLGHVPQGRQLFGSLSVEQNLRVGAYVRLRRNRGAYRDTLARIYEIFPMLAERRNQRARTLSGGQQATLAVARALMSNPRLLVIDEPSAGLAPSMVENLLEVLETVRASGLTVLLVEQNIPFGLRVAGTACLMQRGRIVHQGAVEDLDEERLATHLGVGRLLRDSIGQPRRKRLKMATVSNGQSG